jgi:hypothetical protein
MANRKATFAKRQRETDLKDRAKQKEDRRTQKRGEVRESKGPQIAWDEAVHAVTSDELPPLGSANQGADDADDAGDAGVEDPAEAAPPREPSAATANHPAPEKPTSGPPTSGLAAAKPTASRGPASPRRAG